MVLKRPTKKLFGQTGEITTIIAITSLVVIGVVSLVSSAFLGKKQTTSTKASGTVASLGCIQKANGNEYIFFKRSDASPVCDTNSIQAGSQNDAWLVGNGPCVDNNACGSGKWCYYFDNQYRKSRCLTRDPSCDNGSCLESEERSSTPPPQPTTAPPSSEGFHLTSEVYGEKIVGGVKFNIHVKFNSDGCDGDINLFRDGVHIAGPNGWNRQFGPFDYDEKWAGSFTVPKGQSISVNYRGTVYNCPTSSTTLEDTLQCTLSVDSTGNPAISGPDCFPKNFTNPAPQPTATPTTPPLTHPPSPTLPPQQPTNSSTPTPPAGATNTPTPPNTSTSTPPPTARPGRPTYTPVPTPTATNTPTPSPTPLSSLPPLDEIIKQKGIIRIKIPTTGNEYKKYVYEHFLRFAFDISLKKTNNCGILDSKCAFFQVFLSFSSEINENDITFTSNEVGKFFQEKNEVKPVNYHLTVDLKGENLFDGDVHFDLNPNNLNAPFLEITTKKINFTDYVRIVTFIPKKMAGVIYSEDMLVHKWRPLISKYEIDEKVYPYPWSDSWSDPWSGNFSLETGKSFSLVYNFELPSEVKVSIQYGCGLKNDTTIKDDITIKQKDLEITVPNLNSLQAKTEFELSCD